MSISNAEIITIRPAATTMTRQQLPNFIGRITNRINLSTRAWCNPM